MKRLFLYICILFSVSVFVGSCNADKNTMLIGTWVLKNAEYENLDQFCRQKYNTFSDGIDNSIKMIDKELSTIISNDEKEKLRRKRQNLLDSKSEVNLKQIKESVLKQAETLCNKQTFTFEEKGKFSIRVDNDAVNGTYKIQGDTIQTTIENQISDVYFIKKIENNNLELSVSLQDAKLSLTLSKQ
ncbi:MAG: hypothetical protein IIU11_00105 [Bacteroidales bacterium]|nr:hypothetical protein [Bacteroidales bacterium]